MSYARAAPGAICRGSIPHGKRPLRPFANGACAGCGSASTRRCAARFVSGRDATPTPRRRSWTARVSRPPKNLVVSRGYDGGKQVKGRKRHLLVDTLGLLLSVE